MRFSALFPMVCAVVAFVLSMLCLFAGHKPGFMEDYHIITLNTSTLGHELIPTATTSSTPTATATSISSWFSNLAHNVTNEIEGDLDSIIGDVADKLAKELGIKQWYSLHLMDMCEGNYAPNATKKGASLNVSTCSNQTAMYHFDITKQLNQELEIGPLKLNLSDIDWPSDIQDGLNKLNIALDATFVLYAIGIASAGLCIITSLLAFFLHGSRLVSFGNWGIASLSFLTLLIASIIVTVVQSKATHIINKYGNEIGVYAYRGNKYLILTWVAVACMFLAMCSWVVEFCVGRRSKQREYTEKKTHTGTGRSRWGRRSPRASDEAAFRRAGV
ncbi:uncharacterized protein PAC_12454 [Phialocephala subalpina]|uniref:SUR7 protein n=1 Tax=Phialocephala subalpina TaxID=576137 RepID=A0A1L7XC64_9HELO|nr:uncharacterized protein PAC_12454 [Phialocephala subalpina]